MGGVGGIFVCVFGVFYGGEIERAVVVDDVYGFRVFVRVEDESFEFDVVW